MSNHKNTMAPDSFWLTVPIRDFLNSFSRKGCVGQTLINDHSFSTRLCCHAEAQGIGPGDMDADLLGKLATTCPEVGSRQMEDRLALTARRLTDYLIDKGVISNSGTLLLGKERGRFSN